MVLVPWRRGTIHLHPRMAVSTLAERARTGRAREGELQEQQVREDRRDSAQVREAAHAVEYGESTNHPSATPVVDTPSTTRPVRPNGHTGRGASNVRDPGVRYFTSNCAVMPCMLCGFPSFASGRKQTMP